MSIPTMQDYKKPISKNTSDFVQISRGYIVEMRKLARKSLPAHELLMFLVERMQRNNAIIISQTTLSELLKYSSRTITRAIKVLRDENWVQIVKVSNVNAYIVNSKVFWRTHDGKRYTSFYAEIIAGETDQKETIETLENQKLRHIPSVSSGEVAYAGEEALPPPDQLDFPETLDPDAVPLIKEK